KPAPTTFEMADPGPPETARPPANGSTKAPAWPRVTAASPSARISRTSAASTRAASATEQNTSGEGGAVHDAVGDDHALHFRRALIDARRADVPEEALDSRAAPVAFRREDLEGRVGGKVPCLAGGELRHRRLHRGPAPAVARVRGTPREEPRGFE